MIPIYILALISFYFINKALVEPYTEDNIISMLVNGNSIEPSYNIIKNSPNFISFQAYPENQGYLILMDHFDKGWSLKVNGIPGHIYRAGPFKLISLNNEESLVELSYSPYWKWIILANLLLIVFFPLFILFSFLRKSMILIVK